MRCTKKAQNILSVTAALALWTAAPDSVTAGADPFIGEISYVAFNFAPEGWFQCNGQTLPVNQYAALFSLIGTTYGGDGVTNFKLPDMRGRVPVHQGQHPGGSVFTMGQSSGSENMTLTINNMPVHNHSATAVSVSTSTVAPGATATSTLKAVNSDADKKTAEGNSLANAKGLNSAYSAAAPNVSMSPASIETTLNGVNVNTATTTTVTVGNAGGSQPFSIMQPYTTVNCIIAWQGIFPSRP
ncbi:phage tail protein [Nitrosomonas sp.]|uniref:phage tail protein n=1 Tax=Nitrosomonas sp. TaxID=42353 RepID=UPI001D46E9EE|nr:tail fiber protein [Nitrosomonas sp.]MBX3617353.1 phage tail protein [Nitrosomonas sp.]